MRLHHLQLVPLGQLTYLSVSVSFRLKVTVKTAPIIMEKWIASAQHKVGAQ